MKFDEHFSEKNKIDKSKHAKKRLRYTFLSLIIALGAFMAVNLYHGRDNIVPLFLKEKATVSKVVSSGVPQIGGNFTLTDENGNTVTQDALKGKYTFLFFGFASCPDVCPIGLSKIAAVYEELPQKAQEQTQMFFVTIDPERDTKEVVKEYTDMFHEKIVGLTGSAEQIDEIAKNYLVYYAKRENKEAPEFYMMDHSSYIYLMDKEGNYLRHFGHSLNVDDMISGAKKHIFSSK